MLHSLAARAFIMCMDHHVSRWEATLWVTRNLPKNLQCFYQGRVHQALYSEHVQVFKIYS